MEPLCAFVTPGSSLLISRSLAPTNVLEGGLDLVATGCAGTSASKLAMAQLCPV